jgi:hypothetical protein
LLSCFEASPLAVFSASAGGAATSGGAGILLLSGSGAAGEAACAGGGGGAFSVLLHPTARSTTSDRDSLATVFMGLGFISLLTQKRITGLR